MSNMRCILLIYVLFQGQFYYCHGQKTDLAIYYGRFWSPYKYVDYGNGFLNQAKSNYNFFPSISINKYYTNKISAELSMFFTIYEQYYSTRKYIPAFESSYIAGHIAVRYGYSFIQNDNVEVRLKGGVSIGIMGSYKADYTEVLVYPVFDSITRGEIRRNYTPIFPMLSTGLDISYTLSKRFKLSLAANYQKGFIKISEYDIYYNDGSGINDQRARQWGKGDFYGMQLGLRYVLRNEKKKTGTRVDNKSR